MTLYRKYRPQTLSTLVGHSHIKQTLSAAVSTGKLSHAYLFYGPRGIGKTSTARVLAKMVNCEKPLTNLDPCNECQVCISITDGSNLDLIEIDAASNRGIDDIRSLRENIKLAPSSCRKKVYIIDEVHMLTTDAFNALLKTLEEPPDHALFVLATTEIQKIPPTILSRVQRFDFKLATIEELVESLKNVAEQEKIDIDKQALLAMAKRAQGSFRDAIKYLDQLSSFGKIDEECVEKNLGTGRVEKVIKLIESIANKETANCLDQLSSQLSEGVTPKEIATLSLEILRQILMVKSGVVKRLEEQEDLMDYQTVNKLAAKFGFSQLVRVIENFQKSLEQLRYVTIPSLPLEVAIAVSCTEETAGSLPITQNADNKEPKSSLEVERQVEKQEEHSSRGSRSPLLTDEKKAKKDDMAASGDYQKIQTKWPYILETVRQYNYSLEALLRGAKVADCTSTGVVIEVPYSFHQRIIEVPKSKEMLESIFSDVLERSIKISTVLGERPKREEDIANIEVAQDDEIIRAAAEIFNSETVN